MKTFILKLLKQSLVIAIATLLATFVGIGVGEILVGDVTPWYLIIPVVMVLFNIIIEIFSEVRIKIKSRRNSDE